jgi:hypothetical protein
MVDHGALAATRTATPWEAIFRSLSAAARPLEPYLAEFDFRYNERAALGVNDRDVRHSLPTVSKASASRIGRLTKPTFKQQAKRFMRWLKIRRHKE